MVILNQEACKEFLTSKTPHDMYRFFMRATQLELMSSEYQQAEESKTAALAELASKRELLPLMEADVAKWEQKLSAFASVDKLRAKISRLKDEMAWAFVCEKEKVLEGVARELRAEEARTPKFVQKVAESRSRVDAKAAEQVRVQEELKAAGQEVTELEPRLAKKKSAVVGEKQAVKAACDELRRVQAELRGSVTDRTQVVRRIDDIRASSQLDYGNVRRQREQKIARLEARSMELTTHCRTLEVSVDQFRQAVAAQQETAADLKADEAQLRRRCDTADRKLRELASSRGNDLRRFAAWMPELVRRVEEAHRRGRFHAKPRGPVGANIKLKDVRWALAVEKCLGIGLLNAFCVTDYHDEKLFEEIAKSVCAPHPAPSTVTSRFHNRMHRVPRNPHQFPTVLEVGTTAALHSIVLFCSLAVLDPRVGHTVDVVSPFISVLCHSDILFHGESCPRLDVVHPGRAWSSSPACTWHCSLHYLFLQATPLFPHGVTIVC